MTTACAVCSAQDGAQQFCPHSPPTWPISQQWFSASAVNPAVPSYHLLGYVPSPTQILCILLYFKLIFILLHHILLPLLSYIWHVYIVLVCTTFVRGLFVVLIKTSLSSVLFPCSSLLVCIFQTLILFWQYKLSSSLTKSVRGA